MIGTIDSNCSNKTPTCVENSCAGHTHWIAYHFVWCPKRVKPVLVGEVAADCEALIHTVCADRGWEVLHLAIFPGCVHLFLRASPNDAAHDVVRRIKDFTAHTLRRDHSALRRLPSLWTRSFLSTTASQISEDVILHYIASQKHA